MSDPRLIVIIPDRLSLIIKKGEVTERYYNPGNLFSEVHLVLTNDDRPDPREVQKMVGDAKLFLHNVPAGITLFAATLAWTPTLVRWWAKTGVAIARKVKPQLIRCHGNWLSGFLGAEIKRVLGIPLIISLHGNPDVDYYRGRRAKTPIHYLYGWACGRLERVALQYADFIVAVYTPIVPYLQKHCVSNYAVIHNVVGLECQAKTDYSIDPNQVKLLCVGRQDILEKDPSSILEALQDIPKAYLTLVGMGSLHETLKQKAECLGLGNRVKFIASLNNKEVLELMDDADIYVYSSNNFEISKSTIEAALTGLPVVINNRSGNPAKELVEGQFLLVENTKEGYRAALLKLIEDHAFREALGRRAYAHAQEHWAPEKTEAHYAEIYHQYRLNDQNA